MDRMREQNGMDTSSISPNDASSDSESWSEDKANGKNGDNVDGGNDDDDDYNIKSDNENINNITSKSPPGELDDEDNNKDVTNKYNLAKIGSRKHRFVAMVR